MLNARDIIDLWPSRVALAEDIGVSPQAITNMIARNSIPARYWHAMVTTAGSRSIDGVSFETLSRLAAGQEAA